MSASPDVSCCQEGQVPIAVVLWHTDCPWSTALRMLLWPPQCPPPEICQDWHGHICWICEFQVVESCCGVTWLTVPCPLSWSSSCTLLCCPFHEWGHACAASGVFLQDRLLGKREGSAPLVRPFWRWSSAHGCRLLCDLHKRWFAICWLRHQKIWTS